MKKINKILFALFIYIAIISKVYAASGNLTGPSSVYVGDSFTVSAHVYSSAAWNVHVSASGPVSGCSINQADATADAMDTNKTFSTTCSATGAGTITIKLTGDVTSAADGSAVSLSKTITVSVTEKETESNSNTETKKDTSTETKKDTNTSKTNTKTTTKKTDSSKKSTNNNLKSISVEGYELTKKDSNNYTLIVDNTVDKIIITATAEDKNAKVSGAGEKELEIGENTIEVVVTSESGKKNTINIIVFRKDSNNNDDSDIEKLREETEKNKEKDNTKSTNIYQIICIIETVIIIILLIIIFTKVFSDKKDNVSKK